MRRVSAVWPTTRVGPPARPIPTPGSGRTTSRTCSVLSSGKVPGSRRRSEGSLILNGPEPLKNVVLKPGYSGAVSDFPPGRAGPAGGQHGRPDRGGRQAIAVERPALERGGFALGPVTEHRPSASAARDPVAPVITGRRISIE